MKLAEPGAWKEERTVSCQPIWLTNIQKTVYNNDNTTTVTTLVEHEYYHNLPLQCMAQ